MITRTIVLPNSKFKMMPASLLNELQHLPGAHYETENWSGEGDMAITYSFDSPKDLFNFKRHIRQRLGEHAVIEPD